MDQRTRTVDTSQMGIFARDLSLWVALCMVLGVALGQLVPAVPRTLGAMSVAQVSLPVAVLIWLMIYPMMVQVDFGSVLRVRRQPRGITITLTINWLVKPFTMFVSAWFFLQVVFAGFIEAGLTKE